MECPRCNTSLAEDASFCGTCGYALSPPNGNMLAADQLGARSSQDDATIIAPLHSVAPQPSQPTFPAGGFGAAPQWPQQGMPANWQTMTRPPQGYTPVMLPGTMGSAGSSARPRKRRLGCLVSALLTLVLLVGVVAGAWFLGVRPYLHNEATTQLNQALDDAQSQIQLFQTALPSGPLVIHVAEADLNSYLGSHDTNQLQNLQMTITPTDLELDFTAYGFKCSILGIPIVSNGALQISDVQVQGVLWLVMSNTELTTLLNEHFQTIGQQMHRTVQAVTLKEQEMDIQLQ